MSRSKRKPWVKDSNKYNNWYNKLHRRTNKVRVSQGKRPLNMVELVDPWDVCDWRWGCPEEIEAYRK